MLRDIDAYFLHQEEPLKSCLQFLRTYISTFDAAVTEVWRYRMPFYCYKDKRFCYLWVDKKRNMPYIGFVDGNRLNHPDLLAENRSRMKILLIDPKAAVPVKKINGLIKEAITL